MTERKFDWKDFLPKLIAIALPIALQNLLTTTGTMVDTIMIATTGELSVGAVGLCAQFSSLMLAGYWGFMSGGMLFMAQYWGEKNHKNICRSFGITVICMMAVGIGFCVAAVLFPETIMRMYTDKESIQIIGVEYLKIVGFAYPFQVLSMAMSSLLRSTERVKIPLIGAIVSVCVNVVANYILIFGKFGLPAMGVEGAAIATVLAAIVNAAVIIIMSAIVRHPYLFRLKDHFDFDMGLIKHYFKKCSMILVNEIFMGICNMIVSIVLGHQIESAIVATAVFRTLEGMVIAFFAGFSNASSILVGKCIGAGEHLKGFERAKRIVLFVPITIFGIVMILFAIKNPLLHAMGLSGESYLYGSAMLLIYAFMGASRMTNWVHNDTFRAGGDPVFGTVRELIFSYVMMLPILILSGMVFHLPFLFVFFCAFIDEPIRVILMVRHMFSGRWIKPVTASGLATLEDFRLKYVKNYPEKPIR